MLVGRVRGLASNVRLRPFDTTTPKGRARERVRKAALTALTAAAARGITMLTPLVSLPVTLRYLGPERYGMWQTMTSVVAMMAFTDLGMGNGVLTAIARASGRDDKEHGRRLVSSAIFLLVAIAGALLLSFMALSPFVPWGRVLNVTSDLAKSEAGKAMAAVALCFALNLPLGIVQKVQAGYQEGFQSNLWQCLSSVVGLGALVAAVTARVSLPILALVLMGVPVLVLGFNSAAYFGFQRPWLRPAWGHFHSPTARCLLRTGAAFLAISILTAIGFGSDNLLAAQFLGAATVPQLSVPAALAGPLFALPLMAYMPMWSAYGEAIARGETAWVKQNVRSLVSTTVLITGLAAAGYVLLGSWAIHLLVGKRVAAPPLLLLAFGLWSVEVAASGPGFMVLNGAGRMRPQIWMYLVFTLASIGAKILLTKQYGVLAIPWATAISYLFLVVIPLWLYMPRALRAITGHKTL